MQIQPEIETAKLNETEHNNNASNVPRASFQLDFSLLGSIPGVYLRQKPNYLERIVPCCPNPNDYYVWGLKQDGQLPDYKVEAPILKCTERSQCLQRYCLPGSCRAFEIDITIYQPQIQQIILRLNRVYKFTFFCFMRPIMEVSTTDGQVIGKILFPFMCCEKGVLIKDANDELIFSVIGSCWQWPFLCHMPCEFCQKAVLFVKDQNGQIVTELRKHSSGCVEACCSDSTTFSLTFPAELNPLHRALLLATIIFIDMNHFETSPGDNK